MRLIIILAIFYLVAKAAQTARARLERQHREAEAARMRAEIRRQQIQAQQTKRRQDYLERQQVQLRQEQTRQRREQERQAAQLSELDFRITQAEADIAAGQERIASLYALMDLAAAQQAQATPGSAEDERAQRKIISLQNQIHAAERRIAKAQHVKETAQRKRAA